MSQFQALLEILLFALIILMGMATVQIILRGRVQSHASLVTMPDDVHERGDYPARATMPDDVHERGDYLLALVREGHLVLGKKN